MALTVISLSIAAPAAASNSRAVVGSREQVQPADATATARRLGPLHVTSAAFLDPNDGWVLTTGGSDRSATMLRTTQDGGTTWQVTGPAPTGDLNVTSDVDATIAGSQLSITHDRGRSWTSTTITTASGEPLQFSRAIVGAGFVHLVAADMLYTLPLGADVASPTGVAVAPLTSPELAFAGSEGWMIYGSRLFGQGMARFDGEHWDAVGDPCTSSIESHIATDGVGDVVVACAEHLPGFCNLCGQLALYASTDDGATFHRINAAPAIGAFGESLVVFPGATIVIESAGRLERTDDLGHHWRVIGALPADWNTWQPLHFNDVDFGYVIHDDGQLAVTVDGGRTFHDVTL